MKSFADWTQDIAEAQNRRPLPEKVTWKYLEQEGEVSWDPKRECYTAICRSCGRWTTIYCDPEEFDASYHYCGGD